MISTNTQLFYDNVTINIYNKIHVTHIRYYYIFFHHYDLEVLIFFYVLNLLFQKSLNFYNCLIVL